jgi:hypothetical protein
MGKSAITGGLVTLSAASKGFGDNPKDNDIRIENRRVGCRLGRRPRTVEHPDGMLAVIAAVGAELVQNPLLLRTAGLLAARVNALQVVSSRSSTHSVTRVHDG